MRMILVAASVLILTLGSASAQEKDKDKGQADPAAAPKPAFQGFDSAEKKDEKEKPAEGATAEPGYDGWSDGTTIKRRSPTDPEATDPRFAKPGRFGPVAFASKTPAIIFAYIPSYAWIVGAGFGFTYDPNGIPGPTGPTEDKLAGTTILMVQYMAINEGPFALGPDLMFQGNIAPGAFWSRNSFSGGVSWWFAPWWNAPVLIGGAWHVKVTKVHGLAAITELETPSVRFGFLWR